ncbi:lipopolysaccharide heptosyltransferase II [Halomonas sp. HNIBRBA4712]|uniref:lipopolysaccharide heptosyltransferase II n=1 Tax=Halomonas sp. HNIBRBA4712 TaxID=3373087 RepID=UPI0037475FBF
MASAPRLLVVGPSWVGDMVMAQSLFITLKARHPQATLGVVAPAWSQPILERMPQVDEVLPLAVGHGEFGLKSRRALAAKLKGRFDRAIVLPRSWKAALIPFLARIPERVGFLGEYRYGLLTEARKLDKGVLDQTVKRFVSLGVPDDAARQGDFAIAPPRLTVDHDNLVNLRLEHELSSRPAVGMMPGAEYGPAKQWPPAYFHGLARRLVDDGYEVRIFGGPKDQPVGEQIRGELAHVHNLCGQTALADAVDLLADCRQVITNDSGLMHVAAAVGVPIHALYGSSSPRYTPPLSDSATVHYLGLSCSPCFKRVCPLGHTNCLNQLTDESVYHALKAVQDDAPPGVVVSG